MVEAGTDVRFTTLINKAYLQGWKDAADALRAFADNKQLDDHPSVRLVMHGAADALKPYRERLN